MSDMETTHAWDGPQQSARDRYRNDPTYRQVVNMMEHLLHTTQVTPSEMREAAILASINYEMMTIRRYHIPMTQEMHTRLEELHQIVDSAKDPS
jgi:hypothetical protein